MTEPNRPVAARLQLFVVGNEPHSRRARQNLEAAIETLEACCTFEVVDVLTNYRAALDAGILIAPTLLITTEDARITVAGDMADQNRVVAALKLITG